MAQGLFRAGHSLLDRILAPEFQMVDGDGNWSSKAEELAWVAKNKPSYDSLTFAIRRLDVFENGTAIAAGKGTIRGTDETDPTSLSTSRPTCSSSATDNGVRSRPISRATRKSRDRTAVAASDRGGPRLAYRALDAVESGAAVSFLALTRAQAEDWWRRLLRRPLYLVARDADGIVGTVQLHPAWAPNQPYRADVMKLIVHRRGRRKGLGRQLMLALEREARGAGYRLLTLDSKRGDAGETLYRALGWTVVGTIPRYALDPDGTPHDTVVFTRNCQRAVRRAAMPTEEEDWAIVQSELEFHRRKPADEWIDTLNRLWRKNRFVMSMDGMLKLPEKPPVLTREMLSVSRERWPLERSRHSSTRTPTAAPGPSATICRSWCSSGRGGITSSTASIESTGACAKRCPGPTMSS